MKIQLSSRCFSIRYWRIFLVITYLITLDLLGLRLFTSKNLIALELQPHQIKGTKEGSLQNQPVSVLQNRYFLKTMRPELGIATGQFLNEAYTKTAPTGIRGSLFLNEWFGVEAQYLTSKVSDSDDRKALNTLQYRDKNDPNKLVSPDPEINSIKRMIDATAVLAPFYGKLNLADKMIVYSDLYMVSGISRVNTDQGELNALVLGAGQRFYFTNSFSLRIDFRDHIFNEKRAGEETRKNAFSYDIGASYFFF